MLQRLHFKDRSNNYLSSVSSSSNSSNKQPVAHKEQLDFVPPKKYETMKRLKSD